MLLKTKPPNLSKCNLWLHYTWPWSSSTYPMPLRNSQTQTSILKIQNCILQYSKLKTAYSILKTPYSKVQTFNAPLHQSSISSSVPSSLCAGGNTALYTQQLLKDHNSKLKTPNSIPPMHYYVTRAPPHHQPPASCVQEATQHCTHTLKGTQNSKLKTSKMYYTVVHARMC